MPSYLKCKKTAENNNELIRIFFHDVLNTAGNIRNYAQLLVNAPPEEVGLYASAIMRLSEVLVEEIQTERSRVQDEMNLEKPHPVSVSPSQVIQGIFTIYDRLYSEQRIKNQLIVQHPEQMITTEPSVFRRVLVNLIDNAFNASLPGDVITARIEQNEGDLLIKIHNPQPISPEKTAAIFKPLSTLQAQQHGFGTYGAKKLTEKVLKGNLTYSSDPLTGTEFTLEIPFQNP